MLEWKRVERLGTNYDVSCGPVNCLFGIGNSDLLKLVTLGYRVLEQRGTAQDRKNHQYCYDMMWGDRTRKIYMGLLDVVAA